MGFGGWQGDPGLADNLYADFEAKRRAAIAAGQDPHPPDPVETKTGRFTSLAWTVVGLCLAVALAWIALGEIEGIVAAVIAVAVLVAMIVHRRRLDAEDARPQT